MCRGDNRRCSLNDTKLQAMIDYANTVVATSARKRVRVTSAAPIHSSVTVATPIHSGLKAPPTRVMLPSAVRDVAEIGGEESTERTRARRLSAQSAASRLPCHMSQPLEG